MTLDKMTTTVVAFMVGAASMAAAHAVGSSHPAPFDLVAALPHRNRDQLDRSFWDISDPTSDRYLHHLSLDAIAEMVGAPEADIRSVTSWMSALGASTVTVSPLRDQVTGKFAAGAMVSEHVWGSNGIPAMEHHPVVIDYLLRKDQTEPKAEAPRQEQHPLEAGAGAAYNVENIKEAYGIPLDLQASNAKTLQMVWGPGTFGYSEVFLANFKAQQCPLMDLNKITFDTDNHGSAGGDNYGEGNLDVQMIMSFGLNVSTIVSNTNTSMSTEEGKGFGQAFLSFITELAFRDTLPQVLSLSLGSLSAASCDKLCEEAVKEGHSRDECNNFLQQQRQVCMYLSQTQTERIDTALQILGIRGITIFGSSGDGGSHYSFGPFGGNSAIANTLNKVSCEFNFPVFPTSSPYIVSVGGESWIARDPAHPTAWFGSGGGFAWQFDRPEHQKTTVAKYIQEHGSERSFPGRDAFNHQGRAYPDLAAVGVKGTSQSSPLIAGIFSLVIDHRLNNGLPPLGFLSPRLWQVNEAAPGVAFQDITTGNTKESCATGFPATSGWDPVTGWGRPIWSGLLEKFGRD